MSDHEDYFYLQTVKYASHETENSVWATGQLRFLDSIVNLIPDNANILDVGCGDGISLVKLKELGFSVRGIDINNNKLEFARSKGCVVDFCDMHNLSMFNEKFDVIISSHSLEHSYNPALVLEQFNSVLNIGGLLFIVVPFPDIADYAVEAHVGRDILGTSDPVEGKSKVINFVNSFGFNVFYIREDSFREPEIWIYARKTSNV